MRISERQRYDSSLNQIYSARSRSQGVLDQLATLKRINKLSDDPLGAARGIRLKDQIDSKETYKSNLAFAKGFIEKSELAVSGMIDHLIRAKELSIAMANDSVDGSARLATSKEVSEILSSTIGLCNSEYGDRFVFSGFRSKTPPMSQDGQFIGDDGAIFLKVDNHNFRQINITGRHLFEPDADEKEQGYVGVIQSLKILEDGLVDNDKDQIRDAIHQIDYQIQKASTMQASIGALYTSLNQAEDKLGADQVNLQGELSKIQDVDMFKATSDQKRTETVLNSTLQATQKMLSPSLLQYLK